MDEVEGRSDGLALIPQRSFLPPHEMENARVLSEIKRGRRYDSGGTSRSHKALSKQKIFSAAALLDEMSSFQFLALL